MSAAAPQVARYPWSDVVELIEVQTAFGTVAAGEQALVDAVRELLRSEHEDPAAPQDLLEVILDEGPGQPAA